jgi:hypothetical protein
MVPTYKIPALVRASEGQVVLTDRYANRPECLLRAGRARVVEQVPKERVSEGEATRGIVIAPRSVDGSQTFPIPRGLPPTIMRCD